MGLVTVNSPLVLDMGHTALDLLDIIVGHDLGLVAVV